MMFDEAMKATNAKKQIRKQEKNVHYIINEVHKLQKRRSNESVCIMACSHHA